MVTFQSEYLLYNKVNVLVFGLGVLDMNFVGAEWICHCTPDGLELIIALFSK